MKLYLIRHGEYTTDLQMRDNLTEVGIQNVKNVAALIHHLHLEVSDIFHSGKLRAQQTAELMATGFVCANAPQQKAGLSPDDDVKEIADEITSWDTNVLLVGHLPFMGRLVGHLVVNDENKELIDFETATLVCLEQVMTTRWVIKWALTKDLFVK